LKTESSRKVARTVLWLIVSVIISVTLVWYILDEFADIPVSTRWSSRLIVGKQLPGKGFVKSPLILWTDERTLVVWRGGNASVYWTVANPALTSFGPCLETDGKYSTLHWGRTDTTKTFIPVLSGRTGDPYSLYFPLFNDSTCVAQRSSEPVPHDSFTCSTKGGPNLLVACCEQRSGGYDSRGSPHLHWVIVRVVEFDTETLERMTDSIITPIAVYPELILPAGLIEPFCVGYIRESSP
jgi:hypothetical protein